MTHPAPSLEDLHRNIDLATQYRMEFIKHCMWLAGAVFVFTVSFLHDVVGSREAESKWLVALSWGGMTVSLLGGLVHLIGWDRFYISYRKDFHALKKFHDARQEGLPVLDAEKLTAEGNAELKAATDLRKCITLWRRLGMVGQFLGLGVGLVTIAVFCYLNLK